MKNPECNNPKPNPKKDGKYQKFLKALKAIREVLTPLLELARIVKSIFL